MTYTNEPSPLRVFGWTLATVTAVAVIIVGTWWIRTATSGARGSASQERQTNSGTNRVAAQEQFAQLNADVQAYAVKIRDAKADADAHPGDDWYATNLHGLQSECLNTVAQYNGAAQKVTQAQWRDPSLPFQLDSTVCEAK